MYNLLRPNQEEIQNINRSMTSNEIESVIKTPNEVQMASQMNSNKYLGEN